MMNIRPGQPDWEDRDRFVLSKGHCTVSLYPTLALRGYFDVSLLDTFRRADGHLSGHAEMRHVPGVDMSTGSLGQGFSAAVGMALGAKLAGKALTVYAVLGDGEIQEGQIWEACMYAGAHGLDNLIAIVDSNKVQLDGTVREVLDTGDLQAKFESFGFFTQSIDGHDVEAISDAVDRAKAQKGRPFRRCEDAAGAVSPDRRGHCGSCQGRDREESGLRKRSAPRGFHTARFL